MVKTLLNNKHSQPHQNIYTNQSKDQNRKTARAGDSRNVWQDKGHLENAPRKAGQPAPFSNGSGARASNTKSDQKHKTKSNRTKRIHSTFHLEPEVHADMELVAISWDFPSRRLVTLPAASSPRPLSRSSMPSLSKKSFARSSGRSLRPSDTAWCISSSALPFQRNRPNS